MPGLLLAATIVYLIGAPGVTALGNIPLNRAIWHLTRTIASIVSLILLILACLNQKEQLVGFRATASLCQVGF